MHGKKFYCMPYSLDAIFSHDSQLSRYFRIVKELLPITDREMAQACGMSPIHSAAKGDHVNILEMLIEQGYDVNIKLTKDKITYR